MLHSILENMAKQLFYQTQIRRYDPGRAKIVTFGLDMHNLANQVHVIQEILHRQLQNDIIMRKIEW